MSPDNTPGVRILPPFLYGVSFLAGFLLEWFVPIGFARSPAATLALRAVGALLVVLALILLMSARVRFNRAGTNVNPMRPVLALVLAGPYRFTRNPMYLGLTLFSAGVALIANLFWPILLLAPTLLILQREVIARAERFLEERFGEEYRVYRKRVRRWI